MHRLNQATEQLGQYKTPGLRQLSETAPYMHGGHFNTLEEVVSHYGSVAEEPAHGHREELLQERDWTGEEEKALVQFLLLLSAP